MWLGCKGAKGYGHFFNGHGRRIERAHRLSWEFTYGPIPEGLHVLHHCDNPGCVNPNHLFLGSNADNVADSVKKGRRANQRGEKNGRAKLSEVDVNAIRSAYSKGFIAGVEMTEVRLGIMFGVHNAQIGKIVNGKAWKHLLEKTTE